MKDFTLNTYRELLLAVKEAGYAFFTFEEWCDGKADGRYVILRHDVDLKAGHSLATAKIENELGIKATYYFRIVPESNQPEIIKSIAVLGHEIGYHYEDLSLFNGEKVKALEHFKKQLAHFRQFYPVKTICMHGSPTSKWDNRDIWETNSYRDFGIIGEPYFDFLIQDNIFYLTDTARMWDGDKYNIRDKISQKSTVSSQQVSSKKLNNSISQQDIHSTFDFISWLQQKPDQKIIMITTHPQRWSNNPVEWMKEFIFQNLKNIIKRWIFRRS